MSKGSEVVRRFGCPFCGASSDERCIDQQTGYDMPNFHEARARFAVAYIKAPEGKPA